MKPKLIRLSKSVVGDKEARAVSDVIIHDGYLGMGGEVQKFEQRLDAMFERHSIAVNSGTAALHLAIEALIEPGDEVLVPTITYVATYQAVEAAGGVPVSCDVNTQDLSIDLEDAASKISAKTKLMVPVFYSGSAAALDSMEAFALAYKLRVVYDAAHAFGSMQNDELVGKVGDVFCFSFDGIKNITCGEGGAIVTSDEDVAQYCRDARLLGVKNDTAARFKGKRSWNFDVTGPGYRYHMSNMNAAMGNVQLDRFPSFASKRKSLAKQYVALLHSCTKLTLLDIDYEDTVPHIFPLILASHINRNNLREQLLAVGIETGVHYFPNHNLTRFKSDNIKCPVADDLANRLLSLPLHPELIETDINYVVHNLRNILGE